MENESKFNEEVNNLELLGGLNDLEEHTLKYICENIRVLQKERDDYKQKYNAQKIAVDAAHALWRIFVSEGVDQLLSPKGESLFLTQNNFRHSSSKL